MKRMLALLLSFVFVIFISLPVFADSNYDARNIYGNGTSRNNGSFRCHSCGTYNLTSGTKCQQCGGVICSNCGACFCWFCPYCGRKQCYPNKCKDDNNYICIYCNYEEGRHIVSSTIPSVSSSQSTSKHTSALTSSSQNYNKKKGAETYSYQNNSGKTTSYSDNSSDFVIVLIVLIIGFVFICLTSKHRETSFDMTDYDERGYNKEGYDRDGYDKWGYDRDGYDKWGYDRDGYDRFGYNQRGHDREGFDRYGYDDNGYNKEGYDCMGYNREGFNRHGYDFYGFDQDGYNKAGFDRDGYNKAGFDRDGYGKDGYNKKGFDKEGYYRDGYNIDGYNKQGFQRNGFNKNGFDINGKPYVETKTCLYDQPIRHRTYGEGLIQEAFRGEDNRIYVRVLFKDNFYSNPFDLKKCLANEIFSVDSCYPILNVEDQYIFPPQQAFRDYNSSPNIL